MTVPTTVARGSLEIRCAHRHDDVAVSRFAGLVDGKHPVRVTVMGDAEIIAAAPDEVLERAKMRRTAVKIDVGAVPVAVERRHVHTDTTQGFDRRERRRTMTAVDGHTKTLERSFDGGDRVSDVALHRVAQPDP
jgi:hypothetical protein